MADSSLGSFTFGGNNDTARMLDSTVDSLHTIQQYTEKTGESAESVHGHFKNMLAAQEELAHGMKAYWEIMNNVQVGYGKLTDSLGRVLESSSKQTEELKKQEQLLKDQAAAQDKMNEKRTKALTDTIQNPMKALGEGTEGALDKMFETGGMKLGGPILAGVGLLVAGLSKAQDMVRFLEHGSRTAGLSINEATGGAFNTVMLAANMEMAEKRKFVGKDEYMSGVGTLVGDGGLRAEQLLDTLSDLPEKAHELGLSFKDVTFDIAHLHRALGESAPLVKEKLLQVAETAKDSNYPVKEYTAAVTELTLKTAKYGGNLELSSEALRKNYQQVMDGLITTAELESNLKTATDMLKEHNVNTNESFRLSTKMQALFGEDIAKQSITWASVTKITENMMTQFGLTADEGLGLAKSFVGINQSTGIATKDLENWHSAMAKGTVTLFDSPKEAAIAAASATKMFAAEFERGTVTTADYITMMKTQKDVFGDNGTDAMGKFGKLVHIVDTTNIRMEEMTSYLTQSSKMFRQYGIDEMGLGLNAFRHFNQYVREGSVAIQDYQAILKGPSGATEGMRAMLTEQIAGGDSSLGKAFAKTGTLGSANILIPAIQALAGNGDKDYAQKKYDLQVLSDAGLSGKDVKSLDAELKNTMRSLIEKMVVGMNPVERDAIYSKLWPAIHGGEFTGRGGAVRMGYNMDVNGTLPTEHSGAHIYRHGKEDVPTEALIAAYSTFDASVKFFVQGVKDFVEAPAKTTAAQTVFENSISLKGILEPVVKSKVGGSFSGKNTDWARN